MSKETTIKATGVFIRVAIYGLLYYVFEHGSIFTVDWKAAINAAIIGTIGVIVTGANPFDKRFGLGAKKETDAKVENNPDKEG